MPSAVKETCSNRLRTSTK